MIDEILSCVNKYLSTRCSECLKCCNGEIFKDMEVGGILIPHPCLYLKDKKCSIYKARPLHCEIFPMHPFTIDPRCPESGVIKSIIEGKLR